MNQQRRYLSCLLRLWRESDGDPPLWRASLQSPQREELRGFAGLDELCAYLREMIDPTTPADGIEKGQRASEMNPESEED